MQQVEIRLKGHLDEKWLEWLGDYKINHIEGETTLTGQISDQSDLYGLIAKLRDLGVKLLAVNYNEESQKNDA